MNEVYVKFEGTLREGPVAVGTYLIDAARRLGVELECDCGAEDQCAQCAVRILKGAELLSEPTSFENEHLSSADRKDRQRLACQAKLEKPGEMEVMTVKKEKKEDKKTEEKSGTSEFKDEFKKMPLEEKISSLVELELMALGDTVSYVVNSPYEAFGKVMDVMAGFGLDLEKKEREAKVPEEHASKGADKSDGGEKKAGDSAASKPKPRRTAAPKTKRRTRKTVKKKEDESG
ncbi:MAG: (2Fe-2S)-binding protein [Acidobacteriota bacterium]|nr:(2Fe-2S)-binding protein [Acidobacteriota bacterium]